MVIGLSGSQGPRVQGSSRAVALFGSPDAKYFTCMQPRNLNSNAAGDTSGLEMIGNQGSRIRIGISVPLGSKHE